MTLLSLAAVAVLVLGVYANDDFHAAYKKHSGMELALIERKADSAAYTEPHKALMLYTMIISKCKGQENAEYKRACAKAHNNAGYLLFFTFHNYVAAYGHFMQGAGIAEQSGDSSILATIRLNMGNVYANYNDRKNALRQYLQSVRLFRQTRQWDLMQPSLFNLMLYGYGSGNDSVSEIVRCIPTRHMPKCRMSECNRLLAAAYMAYEDKHPREAVEHLHRAVAAIDDKETPKRYETALLTLAHETYNSMGRHDKALEILRGIEWLLAGSNHVDLLGINYENMANTMKAAGTDKDSVNFYRLRSLEITDSILATDRLSEIRDIEAYHQMDNAARQIEEQVRKRKAALAGLATVSVALLVIAGLLAWIWICNRKLRDKNDELYLRIRNDIKAKEMKARHDSPGSGREASGGNGGKYSTSSLKDTDKMPLFRKILDVMDGNGIYAPDFCLQKLADATGEQKRYVSQVINEMTGKNFSVFLAEYRIREACRRLADTGMYGNFTIEAIGNELGFLSRSNFSATFKKVTGMSPRDYVNAAKRNAGGQSAAEDVLD